jgi:dTDP-N-acetylfucosamine:lipid II N-acetylfucosaminyltransferase
MNLHISYDEKFLDPFIVNAENYTNSKNVYIVITKEDQLKHVKTKNVITCKPELNRVEQAISSLDDFERAYFHSFSELFSDISRSPILNSAKKYLLFYGFEVFGLKKYELDFYLPKTKSYIIKNKSIYFNPKLNPLTLRREVINYFHYNKLKKQLDDKTISALKEFDFVGHFIEEDVKEYIQPIAPSIKWVNWNFFGKNVGVDEHFKQDSASLNKLLIGNSASPFNNHFEAIEYLSDAGVKLEIMAPLSYSGSEEYINKVVELGTQKFKEKFLPLTDFLPMTEYYKLMKDVKAAVFFNLRSQAAGNILWLLTNNIPVFMLEENNLYKMLTKSGIVVYTIHKDLPHFLNDSSQFTAHLNNSIYIEEVFGEKAMKVKYCNLLD